MKRRTVVFIATILIITLSWPPLPARTEEGDPSGRNEAKAASSQQSEEPPGEGRSEAKAAPGQQGEWVQDESRPEAKAIPSQQGEDAPNESRSGQSRTNQPVYHTSCEEETSYLTGSIIGDTLLAFGASLFWLIFETDHGTPKNIEDERRRHGGTSRSFYLESTGWPGMK